MTRKPPHYLVGEAGERRGQGPSSVAEANLEGEPSWEGGSRSVPSYGAC